MSLKQRLINCWALLLLINLRGLKPTKLNLLLSSTTISLILFATVVQPHAEEQPLTKALNFNQQIERLKTAKSVTVSIDTPTTGGSYDWIKNHPKYQCSYESQDPAKILQLIRVLKNAKVREVSANESFLPIVQIEVYFTLPNNLEVQFLFGKEYINEETVDGELNVDEKTKAIPLLANLILAEDLFLWAKQAGKLVMSEQRKERLPVQIFSRLYEEGCSKMLNTNYYRNRRLTNQTCRTSFFNYPQNVCQSGWELAQ